MPLFRTAWFPEIVARIYAERPSEFIWQWADRDNVFLDATMAAEPGFYRSGKTPWTRRLQELCQRPYHNGHRVRKVVVKKASQTGFTEAVLNAIRWYAKFSPRNVIYAIDSAAEAANIRDRLVKTLEHLGEEIFTGDEDDIGKLKLTLRHMLVWFFGSFSAGKFANKQAPFCVSDEAEEHAKLSGDTSTVDNLDSRLKDAEEGLHVILSKPKLKGGVIQKEHANGNQEIFLVPCPYCGTYQEITIDRIKFDHCKNLLGEWDLERVLADTYLECIATYCLDPDEPTKRRAIAESHKPVIVERGKWFATHDGDPRCDPEVVSMHMSDLYSLSKSVSWGRIAIKIIQTKHDRTARQGVWNHNLGLEWEDKVTKPEESDIRKCRWPYQRGTIPFVPRALLLGADIGKSYAKYVVGAIGAVSSPDDLAVIDWGDEIHPDAIAEIVNEREYYCPADGQKHKIMHGALDAKYRVEDSYAACMKAPMRLWPVAGGGGRAFRKSFGLSQLPTYPSWLRLISFNDRDFKIRLYVVRIKREVPPGIPTEKIEEYRAKLPRLLVPNDVTDDLIRELINEHLEEDEETGLTEFVRKGPNHFGDCLKEIDLLWAWLMRDRPAPAEDNSPREIVMS